MAQEYNTYYVKTVKTGLYATINESRYSETRNDRCLKFLTYDDARKYANERTKRGNWQWTVEEIEE